MFRSPVFRAMLQSEMKEKINGVIDIEDAKVDVMKEMIQYMYTANVNWNKIKNHERDLLILADRFQVQELVHNCSSMLGSTLTKDNALDFGIFGEMYNSDALIQKCAKFISHNVDKCLVKGWMEKIQGSPRLMLHLIKNMKESKTAQNSRHDQIYENMQRRISLRFLENQPQFNPNCSN